MAFRSLHLFQFCIRPPHENIMTIPAIDEAGTANTELLREYDWLDDGQYFAHVPDEREAGAVEQPARSVLLVGGGA